MKRWVRVLERDGNAIYEVKSFLCRVLLPFVPVRWNIGWVLWASAKDALYSKEWELHEWYQQGQKLLSERVQILDQVNADIADHKRQPKDRRGVGTPFLMSVDILRSMTREERSKPSDDWKNIIHPSLRQKFNIEGKDSTKPRKASDGASGNFINSSTPQAGRTGYTLDGMADKKIDFGGAETVMEFREPKKDQSSNQNDRKALRKKIVSDNPREDGESEGEYNKRIDAILKRSMNNND